jgi:deoxycytidine triphosphate deaminase
MALGNEWMESNAVGMGIADQQINSASVDLSIGNKIILVSFEGYKKKSLLAEARGYNPHQQMLVNAAEYEPTIRHTEVDLNDFPDGVWIRPGVGVLCSTQAHINIPVDVVGQVLLKSSRGREFYQSCMAGFFDNGFYGEGTLEIYAPVIPIFFQTGLKIVQMRFDKLEEVSRAYTSQPTAKYLGQIGPTGSRDAQF